MKVKSIGAITLTNPIWWENYNEPQSILSEKEETITGGVVVWEQARDISGHNINLSSGDSGWQSTAVKDALRALINGSIGTTTTITLTDDTVVNVRFRHEENNGAGNFSRVVETALSEYYKCSIYLAKV